MTRILRGMTILLAALALLAGTARAEKPLSEDDVTLLLLGGASQEKVLTIVQQRGVDFRMTPDLAKKFHDRGASDDVIEALQKAGEKVQATAAPAPSPAPAPTAAPASATPPPAPSSVPAASPAPSAPVASTTKPAAPPAAPARPSGAAILGDPSPAETQHIIQEFAAKEKLFKEARNNYTYHQINKVQTLDADGNVSGVYQQEWDILYDDSGKRIERVTYAPTSTLQGLLVTKEDIDSMRNIQPFVLTTEEVPDYEIKYLGHVKVDEVTAYVFSIRPKEIKKGRLYFQGTVWVDDRDLQIVKSEGRTVPEMKTKGGENLFPRFTTYREQIDGKYWFPTFTMADDTLYFSMGPVHIKEIIRYSDYKQFKSKVRIVTTAPVDQPPPSTPPPDNPKP